MVSTNSSFSHYVAQLRAANGFELADLKANRQGRLTPAQRRRLGADNRAVLTVVAVTANMGFIAAIVAVATWHLRNGVGTGMAAVAVVCVLVAAATIVRSRQVRSDSVVPQIAVYEGRIGRQTADEVPADHARKAGYFYVVDGAHLPVSPEAYEVLDDTVMYRVYYLPRTQELLSMEPVRPAAARPKSAHARERRKS